MLLLRWPVFLEVVIDGKRLDPKKAADELDDGENGLLWKPKVSSDPKKVPLIDVGDSLSDDGGDGESAVDPLPSAGRLNRVPLCPTKNSIN